MRTWQGLHVLQYAAICVLLLPATGCRSRGPHLSVRAAACRDIDIASLGNDLSWPIAYSVVVILENTGRSRIAFDEFRTAFMPDKGKPLVQRAFRQDSRRGMAFDAYQRGGLEPVEIEPGETQFYERSTSGYTHEIIRGRTRRVCFAVMLLYKGRIIFGPVAAELPDLEQLPQRQGKLNAEGTPLKFKSIRGEMVRSITE
jgi:hypothetical protein